MGLFKTKAAILGLSTVLAVSSLFAQDALVDDHSDGTNANDFEYYWYYYDDNAGVGKDDRPQVATPGKASVIDVDYTEGPRQAFGNTSDTWKVKTYTFKVDSDGDNKFGSMPFTLGSTWKASYGTAQPFVGIGTMLNADGKFIDLTGATAIKFKIKSRVNELSVRFKVQEFQIDTFSTKPVPPAGAFGYHGVAVPVTTEWTEYSIDIPTGVDYPGTWAKDFGALNLKEITKLAWEVSAGDNTGLSIDTLDVDDIYVVNYTFVSPSLAHWRKDPEATKPVGTVLGIQDAGAANEAKIPGVGVTYWYAYNDGAIGGNSAVNAGAELNTETGLLNLLIEDGTGSGDAGKGVALDYTLGKVVKQDTTDVQGFVGIGLNVYDSNNVKYFDATANATGIYFEYVNDADVKVATLEVSDSLDVADASNPDRKSARGNGVVWYKNFAVGEPGKWYSLFIPFDSLSIHSDWAGANALPLLKNKLAKIQFKAQGAEGKGGILQIDNVIVVGGPLNVAVRNIKSHVKAAGFTATYLNGTVNVGWNSKVTNGVVSLVNTKGAVVASVPMTKTTAQISTAKLSAGMYFAKLTATDVNGKTISKQMPVHIVK